MPQTSNTIGTVNGLEILSLLSSFGKEVLIAWVVLKKTCLVAIRSTAVVLRRGREFGHSLGTLTDSVLGQFSGEHQSHSGLNLTRRHGSFLVDGGQLSGFRSNALEDVVDERVHNRHALLADSGVRVDLLQHFVDV